MKVKDPTSETAIKLIQSATELFNDFGYTKSFPISRTIEKL